MSHGLTTVAAIAPLAPALSPLFYYNNSYQLFNLLGNVTCAQHSGIYLNWAVVTLHSGSVTMVQEERLSQPVY